ncbi:I78 family peptidase inhibitor [Pseudomonas sp. 21LCFQ02]|uniref:I78 family peptidase inhibitor n=1 Tax=Pseudomonas sp. 21LCFQ02 TaxID=2957505 RepID=UPI00209AB67F|nr:I78 family peptidase inhibitor [Pseudomonas sp. 21LCFQ02]MCO8168041.1 I78 family peptidase inhibitor [Pseudomonas sp. 21LCFQ02]
MPWKFATLGFVAVTSLLAGCSTTSAPESPSQAPKAAEAPARPAGDGRCDAGGAQSAVGKQASLELLNQVRSQSGAMDARILGPNDMVTLEYRSERVNVNTDATGKVIRVNCG